MNQTQLQRTRRGGFTLIELLVVMAIIAVLVGLLMAGVMRVLGKVDELNTRNDFEQMSIAIRNFQTSYNVEYIPSRLILCESKHDYFSDAPADTMPKSQLHLDSYQYLQRVWPRLLNPATNDWGTVNTPTGGTAWTGIDWSGDGIYTPPVLLTGDQCLVFFLAGIGANQYYGALQVGGVGGGQGFSSNQQNPAQNPNANPNMGWGDRVSPFFNFSTGRFTLVPYRIDPNTFQLTAGTNGYYSYLDPIHKQPYAYFSSYKAANGYNRYQSLDTVAMWPISTDCPTLNDTIAWQTLSSPPTRYPPPMPYNDGQNYYYRDTFQIISAGRDAIFGPGGLYIESQAGNYPPPEADDMANFHRTATLGIP